MPLFHSRQLCRGFKKFGYLLLWEVETKHKLGNDNNEKWKFREYIPETDLAGTVERGGRETDIQHELNTQE